MKSGEKPAQVQEQIPKPLSTGLNNHMAQGLVPEFVSNETWGGKGGAIMYPCSTLGFCLLVQKCLPPLWNECFGVIELEEALGPSNTADFKLCSLPPRFLARCPHAQSGPSPHPDCATLYMRRF